MFLIFSNNLFSPEIFRITFEDIFSYSPPPCAIDAFISSVFIDNIHPLSCIDARVAHAQIFIRLDLHVINLSFFDLLR